MISLRKNRRGDIPTTILVIGVIALCGVALYSFYSSNARIETKFVGVGLVEKMNSLVEENAFYGRETGTEFETLRGLRSSAFEKSFQSGFENGLVNHACLCESFCGEFSSYLIQSSEKNNLLDPLLLLSLMMQESDCLLNPEKENLGVMQISPDKCGSYGLSSDLELCKNELETPELNIEAGAQILREYFEKYKDGINFKKCSGEEIFYLNWEAALRAYDGLDCNDKIYDNFVEDIIERYNLLNEKGSSLEQTGKSFFGKEKVLFSVRYLGS